MNVLVYSGPDVVQHSLTHTLQTLRTILLPHYSIQSITPQALLSQPWPVNCALLVFPRLRRTFESASSSAIATYVENGGALLCAGTGATYAPRRTDFSLGMSGLSVASDITRPLRFLDHRTGNFITLTSPAAKDSDWVHPRAEFVGFGGVKNVKVFARLAQDEIVVLGKEVGGGTIVLWSTDFDLPQSAVNPEGTAVEAIPLILDSLRTLGLQLPSTDDVVPMTPLPQFLVSHPDKPTIVSQIIKAISVPPSGILKDANDTFHFHTPDQTPDPSEPPPKYVVTYHDGQLPAQSETPLFDLSKYFAAISAARAREGCRDGPHGWGIGEALLYGQVVTSTQTMLDKNPHLLSELPTPIVSLASHQLMGRGRGSNVWVSPVGCLQFSLLLRVSLTRLPPNKLVFVQYLFGLAVADACRDDAVLGALGKKIRLKWPNDIYAVVGPGESDVKKIGGILVNASFTGNNVDIVIGCGLNILNPPPVASLAQLLFTETDLSLELTAAAILAKFEPMWAQFIQGNGSFAPFMASYLERWLHSDQQVTLTTTTPHTKVRIVGITPDHGLLRTMPERGSGFIDLQPDSNSFDIMAGMIKAKA
ncbi:hypothetical protein BD779DRAFT_1439855 [Infundibulicybe gibba]|nr:hypothetical protein BD779DRAFT_1439855 [Infundibulicybe gibba]